MGFGPIPGTTSSYPYVSPRLQLTPIQYPGQAKAALSANGEICFPENNQPDTTPRYARIQPQKAIRSI